MNFSGVAFADVIDFLRDVSGANIHVDWKILEAAGIGKDAPVKDLTAALQDQRQVVTTE